MTLPKTYTALEVAEALGMSERWVRKMVKDGAAHTRLGHKLRFTEEQYLQLRADCAKSTVKQSMTTGRKKSA